MTDRIGRLRDIAAALGADAAIVTHPANRRYFSGFPAEDLAPDESAGVLLVTTNESVLYTGPSNLPWASATVRPPVIARKWERPWPEFLAGELERTSVQNAAFEDRAMTVADHSSLVGSGAELIPAGNAFHAVREVKDDNELASISDAARITDTAFALATDGLQQGITERELAWRVEKAMRELGAHPAFPPLIAAGPHGARPHHDPTDRQILEGEPIVIDIGASVDGYTADLTRTIVIGDPPPLFTERYNSVLAAQRSAVAGARAGITGGETDRLAREALTAAGFGEQFVHWIGHGVGLLVHEGPVLSPDSIDVLQPGNVITIEPGIYFEGWGGIRIEDLCVVTSTGLEILSNAPK